METAIGREQIVGCLSAAAYEVFTVMLATDIVAGEPYSEKNPPGCTDTLMSLIGLAGEWTGTGGIRCTAACACRMASAFLLTEYEAVNSEVLDALAELTNMIVGNFKLLMEPHTGPLGLSIPSVVYGRNYTLRNGSSEEWTVVPFHFGNETFEIRICLMHSLKERAVVQPAEIAR
jgi:chemotaxis protein CheX